ncbi:Cobalt-zinc-cadmium resistance protein [Methylophaga lonarensis MPL]|uniref:Cation-efflux pump FieF n=1 Tax=Methylophaga lonarensis MPL TaxID=1286106 RepID=M7PQI1_9GAMM|nr:Cobalt-zinc-cadmium resistance protein [Methylophaga lonarensis MPL]
MTVAYDFAWKFNAYSHRLYSTNYTELMTQPQPINQPRLMRFATYASVTVAVVLIAVKAYAWWLTSSVSMLATLIDSSLDLLASLITLFAVWHSLRPADKEHRFGHGKAEPLAAAAQSVFVAGSALLLLHQAVDRLIHPKVLEQGLDIGIIVMLIAIGLTSILLSFQRYVIKHTQSTAIRADALHYKTDLLVNMGVIVALVMTLFGWQHVDAIIGLLIAFYILHSAWEIVQSSIDLLMDRELPDDQRALIKEVVLSHPSVQGIHALRTRRSGLTRFIQFHLELDEKLSLGEAHRISKTLESELKQRLGAVEVIIHEQPARKRQQ